jgi:ribosomal protein L24
MASHGEEMYTFPPDARWDFRVGYMVMITRGKFCGHSGHILDVIPPGGVLRVWSYDRYMVTVFVSSCALVVDEPPAIPDVQDIRLGNWVVVCAGPCMGGQGEVMKVMPRSVWVCAFRNTVYRLRKTSVELGVKATYNGVLVQDLRDANEL